MPPLKVVLFLTVMSMCLSITSAILIPPPILRVMCAKLADAEELANAKALIVGKKAVEMIARPIAVVGGLKAAAVGTGMKVAGAGIKTVGLKMAKDGGLLEVAGIGVKGVGLGTAALGVKPLAEKVLVAGVAADKTMSAVGAMGSDMMKGFGETSIRVDATIDSPVVGHHHKEVRINDQDQAAPVQQQVDPSAPVKSTELTQNQIDTTPQAVEQHPAQQPDQQPQQTQSSPTGATLTRSKRANQRFDPEVFRAALNLMRESKLENCVARAVCDLNCNPQGFGQDGKTVFMNMVRLQGSNSLDASDLKMFQEAATKGRNFTGKCEQCGTAYKNCSSKSSDLIKMASHIRMEN